MQRLRVTRKSLSASPVLTGECSGFQHPEHLLASALGQVLREKASIAYDEPHRHFLVSRRNAPNRILPPVLPRRAPEAANATQRHCLAGMGKLQ